jgi:hypothetical protein
MRVGNSVDSIHMDKQSSSRTTSVSLYERLKGADPGFWWVSFVDPEDGKLLGVVIVWGESFDDALTRCGRLGVNPGGGVRGTKLPKEAAPDKQFLDRLLSAEEIVKKRLGYAR